MPQAAVVFESLMGNTRHVAEGVAAGIRESCPAASVSCQDSRAAGSAAIEADLLVVGAPTHFFSLPRRRSRSMWMKGYRPERQRGRRGPEPEPGASGPGVREWLDTLPDAAPGRLAAAFDTRLDRAITGSASRRIARGLRRRGYRLATAPAGFVVEDMAGPLRSGELDRARAWGAELGRGLRTVPPDPAAAQERAG